MEKKILQAIKEDKLYDFISSEYWNISKTDLKDLILEIYYILYEEDTDKIKELNNKIANYLIENRGWEE